MTDKRPTILIHDAATGHEIIREMTDDEIQAITNPLPDYLPISE